MSKTVLNLPSHLPSGCESFNFSAFSFNFKFKVKSLQLANVRKNSSGTHIRFKCFGQKDSQFTRMFYTTPQTFIMDTSYIHHYINLSQHECIKLILDRLNLTVN